MKILNYLKKKPVGRNADYCKKKWKLYEESRKNWEHSSAKIKAALKTENRKMNNTEERINDLEDQIMVFTQSKQWEAK